MSNKGSRRTVSLGGGQRVAALAPGGLDATPQRMRHALPHGTVGVEAGARRIGDPFDALRTRGSLDADPARNTALWEAGARLRRHWHGGGFDGLTALDMSREQVDGGLGQGATTPTEAALRHREAYSRAVEAVGGRLLPILKRMVVDGVPVKDLCHLVAETQHARTAEALVVERLREGLHRLAEHWGMVGDGRRSRPPGGAVRASPPCRD